MIAERASWTAALVMTAIFWGLAVSGPGPASAAAASQAQALDAGAPIPYHIEDGDGIPGHAPGDHQLAAWAIEAWSRESGGALKFVEVEDRETAVIHVVWGAASQGLFGQTHRITVDGRAGAMVFVMPDVRQLGAEISEAAGRDPLFRDSIVYLTAVHELGHAVGLEHTADFADIMYSFVYGGDFVEYFMRYRRSLDSREDIARRSGLSTGDRRALAALYSDPLR